MEKSNQNLTGGAGLTLKASDPEEPGHVATHTS